MAWLAIHMWFLLLLAFLLGLALGWWIWHRQRAVTAGAGIDYANTQESSALADSAPQSAFATPTPASEPAADAWRAENVSAASTIDGEVAAKTTPSAKPAPAPTPTPLAATQSSSAEPLLFDTPTDGPADDLKKIKGIGPAIEKLLNSLGIHYFQQIASWDRAHVAWVDQRLQFPGRIDREDWINQAKTLTAGGETDFAKRYDKGETPSSYGGGDQKDPKDGGTGNT
ncbi:MAG: hypothetical protein AAFY13_07155 [Pseudomonadota bacterium]